MKNRLYKQTRLIMILAVMHYSVLHSAYQYIQQDWHEPLVHLYYKGGRKDNKKDAKTTIQIFEQACQNITSAENINQKNIKSRQLEKKQLSKEGYDLEALRLYYLFHQIDQKQNLTDKELQIGEAAITKLYNKGSRSNQANFNQIIVSIEDTKDGIQLVDNKEKPNYKNCAALLAKKFNDYQKNQNVVKRTNSSESRESNRSNNNIAGEEHTIPPSSSANLQSGNGDMHLRLNGRNKNMTANPLITQNLLESQQKYDLGAAQLSIPSFSRANQGGASIDSNMSESRANSDTDNDVERFSAHFHKNKKLSREDTRILTNVKEEAVTMNKTIKKLEHEKRELTRQLGLSKEMLDRSLQDPKEVNLINKLQQLKTNVNNKEKAIQELESQVEEKEKTIQNLQQQLDNISSKQTAQNTSKKGHNPIIYIICFVGGILASKKFTQKKEKESWQDHEQDLLSENDPEDTFSEPLPKKTKRKRN